MTVLSLLRLWQPTDFATWYQLGAEYVETVAEGMGFDTSNFVDYEAGMQALADGRLAIPDQLRRSIAADLLADARFCEPFCEWMPLWYELGLIGPVRYADLRLTRVAKPYCVGVSVPAPRFSRPQDVLVDGVPAVNMVSGFVDRFVFADAILHLEWFVHVARESGIIVPQELVDRTHKQSVAYYTGTRTTLDRDVCQFQALLFQDDLWVKRINEQYELNSTLFDVWEQILTVERNELESQLREP
ncbi:hypothetical protein [Natronocalculus amylovorans]|uniref:DUF8116 domain-containing protein n=1 Tax=Natronocalculus amylovorans TaxID=2917812 RepID=A0AAE3FTW6_9EURY|nr:hypothetical protein [Natronocalculus amylovorans]MCL9815522.1 hypothetical protein [Natronocalculus amylovorans]NUE01964.1 hypothetical protein [Halorubraceae archaeon YAN]